MTQKFIPHKAGEYCPKLGSRTHQDNSWSHCKSRSLSANIPVPHIPLTSPYLPHKQPAAITSGRAIPALSAIYLFWTFGASGAISAAGQAMGREEGLDNDHPRKHIHQLEGFPLRLRSAHYALMENFPGTLLSLLSLPDDRLHFTPKVYCMALRCELTIIQASHSPQL
jgi:hypothetical protein